MSILVTFREVWLSWVQDPKLQLSTETVRLNYTHLHIHPNTWRYLWAKVTQCARPSFVSQVEMRNLSSFEDGGDGGWGVGMLCTNSNSPNTTGNVICDCAMSIVRNTHALVWEFGIQRWLEMRKINGSRNIGLYSERFYIIDRRFTFAFTWIQFIQNYSSWKKC